MTTPPDAAKSGAWLAARTLSGGDRSIASAVLQQSERDVMRRLVIDACLGGDEGAFWRLVQADIEGAR